MMAYDGYMQKVVPFIESHRVNNIFVDSYLGTKLELKELGRIIQPYEEILYITGCKMHSNAGKKVLVCVTDSRLLILNKGWIGNRYQHSVFLDRISSTQRGRGLVFGSVNVNMMGNEEPFSLYGFWLKDTEQFVRTLEEARFNYENMKHGTNNLGYGYGVPQGYYDNVGGYGNGYGNYNNGYNTNQGYNGYNQGYYEEPSYEEPYGEPYEEIEEEPYVDERALAEYEIIKAQLNLIYRQGLIDRGTLEKRLKQERVKLGLE